MRAALGTCTSPLPRADGLPKQRSRPSSPPPSSSTTASPSRASPSSATSPVSPCKRRSRCVLASRRSSWRSLELTPVPRLARSPAGLPRRRQQCRPRQGLRLRVRLARRQPGRAVRLVRPHLDVARLARLLDRRAARHRLRSRVRRVAQPRRDVGGRVVGPEGRRRELLGREGGAVVEVRWGDGGSGVPHGLADNEFRPRDACER